jgi:hypothetical protein
MTDEEAVAIALEAKAALTLAFFRIEQALIAGDEVGGIG